VERRRVFVSYVRVSEEQFTRDLVGCFETENLDVWMDRLRIGGGLRGRYPCSASSASPRSLRSTPKVGHGDGVGPEVDDDRVDVSRSKVSP
jgi:hypothetical protein